jgi:transcriptional regulator with XRE-family HTH domain
MKDKIRVTDVHFKLIEQRRQQLGIPIKDISKAAMIEPATYYNAKAGRTGISAESFILLCKAVDIKILNLE